MGVGLGEGDRVVGQGGGVGISAKWLGSGVKRLPGPYTLGSKVGGGVMSAWWRCVARILHGILAAWAQGGLRHGSEWLQDAPPPKSDLLNPFFWSYYADSMRIHEIWGAESMGQSQRGPRQAGRPGPLGFDSPCSGLGAPWSRAGWDHVGRPSHPQTQAGSPWAWGRGGQSLLRGS